MAFTGSLEERQAIRELYGRFGDASSRQAREEWLDCWSDDGQWHTHLFLCEGTDALRQQWDTLWENFQSVIFISDVGAIEVNGSEATGRAAVQEIIRMNSGGLYKLLGRYEDRLVLEDGLWRFQRRTHHMLAEELSGS